MFDPFFRWLESTAVSVWIVESPSLFAFPGILAVHTVGLGLLAGLNGALDLRLLGMARSIPPAAFTRVLPIIVILRSILRRAGPGQTVPATTKLLAAASLLLWAAVIAAGRFLAYTCTRLTVDSPC